MGVEEMGGCRVGPTLWAHARAHSTQCIGVGGSYLMGAHVYACRLLSGLRYCSHFLFRVCL